MRLTRLALAAVLASSTALAAEPPRRVGAPAAIAGAAPQGAVAAAAPGGVGDAAAMVSAVCGALPKPRSGPPPFPAGELLEFDVDVMGVRAGAMQFKVLPQSGRGPGAEIPIRVTAESNTFFTKVRKVKAELVSQLRVRDLRPHKFREDLLEGQQSRVAQVTFAPNGEKAVNIEWRSNAGGGKTRSEVKADALDYAGGIFLFRAIPLKVGQPFCFEVYAMKRMWRVEGKVEAREHVSIPAGEFDALHLSATATRLGPGKALQREVHVWLSDDERRLPLAAMGVIDLGPVRATLARVERADFKATPARPGGNMEW